jgi:putative aldouronate transport system permease protein
VIAALPRKTRKIHSFDDRFVDSVVMILSLISVVIVLYPIIFVVSASISEPQLVLAGKVTLFPKQMTVEGYTRIFQYKPLWRGYFNTILYTAASTVITLITTLPAAYALSRRDLRGRGFFTFYFAFTMFFSAGLIPTYLAVQSYGMINTVWPLLFLGAVSMHNLIVVRTYYTSSIPYELTEAAFIDGCSNLKLFSSIIIPLAKPVIAVIALYAAVAQWNAYFTPMIYLTNAKMYPLQVHLRNILILGETTDFLGSDPEELADMVRLQRLRESMKYGLIVVSTLPMLCVYPFLQRFFVKGVMMGSIKG